MGNRLQTSIPRDHCHTETYSGKENSDSPLWHPSLNQSTTKKKFQDTIFALINVTHKNSWYDQLPVKPQIFRSAGYPKNVSPVAHLMSLRIHVKNIPKWKRRKQNIFSQMISFQHWTLWCNCKTHSRWKLLKRSKVKKKICSIVTLLGMFVMLLLFHLSLGDGQCSWNLNIIKAFQGPLPKKLETSRAKVQTLRKGGEKKSWCQQLVW